MSEQTPRCFGAETENSHPACANEPVRDVAFKAPGSDEWHLTQWCDDCRYIARADGYQTCTWTDCFRTCQTCHRPFRGARENINLSREGTDDPRSEAEIVSGWEYCLACIDGAKIPGEHAVPDDLWSCLTCGEIMRGDAKCMKPRCVAERERGARRMGLA